MFIIKTGEKTKNIISLSETQFLKFSTWLEKYDRKIKLP